MVYAPGIGTGYVSVGDYLDSNRDTLAREQGQITQGVGGQINAAQQAINNTRSLYPMFGAVGGGYSSESSPTPDWSSVPGYADTRGLITSAQSQATALGSHGGVSDYFQKHFGDSRSQGNFDANLLGYDASGLQARANALPGYLDQPYTAPPAAATPAEPARPETPPDYPARDPFDWPAYHGPEDAPIDNQNPWGGGG